MYISKRLKELRTVSGFSQEKLAELLDVSRQTISSWENERSYPDMGMLIEISEQYDLQVLRFFMLSAHYRSPLNFSADLMEAAGDEVTGTDGFIDSLGRLLRIVARDLMNTASEGYLLKNHANPAPHWLKSPANPIPPDSPKESA